MLSDLPNLKHEQCVPYSRLKGRIGWSAHRVSTHINMFCTKRSRGCSNDVQVTTTPANRQPSDEDTLCRACKNKVFILGLPHEHRRLAIRQHTVQLIERLIPQLPEELNDIIAEFMFTKKTNPLHVMQTGCDTLKACQWRSDKYFAAEKRSIIKDEKDSRDWFEYMEGHGRTLTTYALAWGG